MSFFVVFCRLLRSMKNDLRKNPTISFMKLNVLFMAIIEKMSICESFDKGCKQGLHIKNLS